METITKVFEQQSYMRTNKTHSVPERIVIIHQPYEKLIVRGKQKAKVDFGSKTNVSLVDGYAFLDYLYWGHYNEGGYLILSVDLYKQRNGYYHAEVMGDRIY